MLSIIGTCHSPILDSETFLALSDFPTLCAVVCPSYAAGVTPAGNAEIAPVGKLAENV